MRDARRIRTPRAFKNVRELQTATELNLAHSRFTLPSEMTPGGIAGCYCLNAAKCSSAPVLEGRQS